MAGEHRFGRVVVLVLAAAVAMLPVAAFAAPPDGVPPACGNPGGGPGGGNGNDPCNPTTTTPTTVPVTVPTTVPVTVPTTVPVTVPTTTTTAAATTTTSTAVPIETTTTTPTAATTTTLAPATTATTSTTQPVTPTTAAAGTPSVPGGSAGAGTVGAANAGSPGPSAGLHTVDMAGMDASLAGAVMIVAKAGDTALEPSDMPEAAGGLSVSINRLLGPVAPPALVDAVASPLVVLEALVTAMTSSSQSLIVPGIVLLVGVGVPGRRRRGAGATANPALILGSVAR